MALTNISGGALSPQDTHGLLSLLMELDEAKVTALLESSEGSAPRMASPFTGLLLRMNYDPSEVLRLVNEIWPARVHGHHGRGRKPVDPLPLVYYLLPICEANYGTVPNVLGHYRRLKADNEFRRLGGYDDRVPSRSVFREVAVTLANNWPRFRECVLSSDASEKLVRRILREFDGDCNKPSLLHENVFTAKLPEMGWNGKYPPRYQLDIGLPSVPLLAGSPRGVPCGSGSGLDSVDGDAAVPTLIRSDVPKSPSKRYQRDWNAYNLAQGYEYVDVKSLLGGLSALISILEDDMKGSPGRGRPRCQLGHAVFATVWKTYLGFAGRRLRSPLEEVVQQGYLRDIPARVVHLGGAANSYPKPSTVGDYMKADWLTPLLLELVSVVAGPLREVDTVFAIDGTGLSTRNYERWLDVRPGNRPPDGDGPGVDTEDEDRVNAERRRNGWVKLHAVAGVETHVIVRAAISPGNDHDNPYFKGLVSEAASRFNIRTMAADLAYSSRNNLVLADQLGFEPAIQYKSNTRPPPRDGSPWSRHWHHQREFPEEFLPVYLLRNNVESTFSAYKRLFPAHLRTKLFCAKVNESLCKTVAYNLSVLARQLRIRGIDFDLPAEALTLEDCIGEVMEMRKPKSESLNLAA